jgi:DNA-binding NarL/FixJ family response regulator
VLDLLRDGLTTKEIAARLYISGVTVRTHIASILRKLGVDSREAATKLLERS